MFRLACVAGVHGDRANFGKAGVTRLCEMNVYQTRQQEHTERQADR